MGAPSGLSANLHRLSLCVCSVLIKLMMSDSMMTYIVEIARVLGNLTKYEDVRALVHEHKSEFLCAFSRKTV